LGCHVIHPGHGPSIKGTQDVKQKIDQYISHRLERENQIVDILWRTEQSTVEDIVNEIYVDLPERALIAAQKSVTAHLDKLRQEDRVEMSSSGAGGGKTEWKATGRKKQIH
jgi:ribonuclease/clavin/mitogillin